MRSPATGIAFCKTEFRLPGVGYIWWSRSQIFYFTFSLCGFLFMLSEPSATLDKHFKKRLSALADDEKLKNNLWHGLKLCFTF